jgi:hypothetical protein
MDNVQNCESYIVMPPSDTYRSYLYPSWFNHTNKVKGKAKIMNCMFHYHYFLFETNIRLSNLFSSTVTSLRHSGPQVIFVNRASQRTRGVWHPPLQELNSGWSECSAQKQRELWLKERRLKSMALASRTAGLLHKIFTLVISTPPRMWTWTHSARLT